MTAFKRTFYDGVTFRTKEVRMQALREEKNVKGKKITIDLPEDFRDQKVEIIVLPYAEEAAKKGNLERLLMDGPTLTDEEIKQFLAVREEHLELENFFQKHRDTKIKKVYD